MKEKCKLKCYKNKKCHKILLKNSKLGSIPIVYVL